MKDGLRRLTYLICFPAVANLILLCAAFLDHAYVIIPVCVVLLFYWIFLNILPYPAKPEAPTRLTILMGGRSLCYWALYGFLIQLMIFIFFYPFGISIDLVSQKVFWINGVVSLLVHLFVLWNGILRIFFTSTRLRFSLRLLMVLCMWIPVVNLVVLLYALRKVHQEYDFGCYQASVRQVRVGSDLCKTQYPLLLVHGIGFRDLRYFNYWGRIPRELTRYGATVHYGNQEAFGTIVSNAEDIKAKIFDMMEETGTSKVNILAHSKGGLDSRYAISQLGMDEYVASLTTFNTPHYGSSLVDFACGLLPERIYCFIARIYDRMFTRFGDRHPDFYTAVRQLGRKGNQEFNEQNMDSPKVYYQSYATIMKHCFSDLLLTIPYCIIYPQEGKNDGLVSIDSAKWGEFKGVITNRYSRGISHGDIIDLKREDYRGFDVVERYVQIVSELKEMGY